MARLMDRNANVHAHDYASPPYCMSAVYVVYSHGPAGVRLKVGTSETQSKDLAEVLRGVHRRVRLAVPCEGPRRKPIRPVTFVWVILALAPVVRHELEQALVEQFGHRRFDPTDSRRREFCDPAHFGGLMHTIDSWREALPDVLSESLFSEDGGLHYVAPRALLPYTGQTEGLWVEPPSAQAMDVDVHRRSVPTWKRVEPRTELVVERGQLVDDLMRGHHSQRVERLLRALRSSPAAASSRGDGYGVTLDG